MHRFILVFLSSFFFLILNGFAQSSDQKQQRSEAYRPLINYVPKSLRVSQNSISSDSIKLSTNTIQMLWMYSDLVHTSDDRKFMDQFIRLVASELFADDKKILLRKVGGYAGCPDKSVDTIYRNGTKILELPLCVSCTDGKTIDHLISVFNTKMYALMKMDPPTPKTALFYGEYKGIDEHKHLMKLVLNKDRSFHFRTSGGLGHGGNFTQGFWQHRKDTLILNSGVLEKQDSLVVLLQSGKRIEFNHLKWILKRGKLKPISKTNWKFKKANP